MSHLQLFIYAFTALQAPLAGKIRVVPLPFIEPLCCSCLSWIPAQRCTLWLVKPKGSNWLEMWSEIKFISLSLLKTKHILRGRWRCGLSYMEFNCFKVIILFILNSHDISFALKSGKMLWLLVFVGENRFALWPHYTKMNKLMSGCTTEALCRLQYERRHWFTNAGNLFLGCCHRFHRQKDTF